MTTPSPAAMRAATDIIKTVLPFNQRTQDRIVVIAEIIDRETKLPELVEAANGLLMQTKRDAFARNLVVDVGTVKRAPPSPPCGGPHDRPHTRRSCGVPSYRPRQLCSSLDGGSLNGGCFVLEVNRAFSR